MLTKSEEKILEMIARSQIATKDEIRRLLKDDGQTDIELNSVIDTVTRSLVEKKLLNNLNLIGSACFAITQKGSRVLQENE